MNHEETAEVLAYLSAAYRAPFTEANVAVWLQELADLDGESCLAGARRLVKVNPRFPSIAELRASTLVEQDRVTRTFTEALEPAPPTPEEKQAIRRFHDLCKETIASQRRTPHDHKGPGPCPACGGPPGKPRKSASVRLGRTL